jgi:hypothetical protein
MATNNITVGIVAFSIGVLSAWVTMGSDDDWTDEETDNPLLADDRNFYKVEKWTKDGLKIDRMLYAGNNLEKARNLFADAIKHRPRIRLTIRQRTRVLYRWPEEWPNRQASAIATAVRQVSRKRRTYAATPIQ